MPTLGIGDTFLQMKQPPESNGFTLIELLVVVVIIGIMAVLGVQLVAGGMGQQTVEKQAQSLAKQLNFMCEKAVFENRPFAVEFTKNGRQFITHRKQQWHPVDAKKWPQISVVEHIDWEIYIQGKPQHLSQDFSQKPHIICYTTGQMSAFELVLRDRTTDTAAYQLSTQDSSTLSARWLDES